MTPAPVTGALGTTNLAATPTLLYSLIVENLLLRFGREDFSPVDALREAEIRILKNGHRARPDPFEGAQVQGAERSLDDVKGRKELRLVPPTNCFQVPIKTNKIETVVNQSIPEGRY